MTNEEAIKILESWKYPYPSHYADAEFNNAIDMAIEALNNEPKKGEWIKKIDYVGFVSYICSECGDELELEDCSDSYYCANCGAKMREANTEQYITKEDYKYNKKKHRWEPPKQ